MTPKLVGQVEARWGLGYVIVRRGTASDDDKDNIGMDIDDMVEDQRTESWYY